MEEDRNDTDARQDANIINKLGLHARASAKLTQTASAYACDLWLERNGRQVNAKSIIGVMMLAAAKGQHHPHRHRGQRRRQAMAALRALIADKFGKANEHPSGKGACQ
ncbi:MAG: HPr family phosphocarrier protein [Zoogloea sp.]|nr:HPr family phosphocarrier protein [Zoogloea sp.]